MSAPKSTEPAHTRIVRLAIRSVPYALVGYGTYLMFVRQQDDAGGGLIVGGIMLWTLLFVLRIMARHVALMAHGVDARATVLSAVGAGRIDDQPAFKVTARIEPEDGEPFTVSRRIIANGVQQLQLRSENRVLRMEKDLLEKAAAFFAAKNTPSR